MTQVVHRGLKGCEAFLRDFLGDVPPNRILLVRGQDSYRNSGAAKVLDRVLTDRCVVFSEFSANPKEEDALRGVELLRRHDVQRLVAVGGGSVMDMAKLINHFGAREPGPYAEGGDMTAGLPPVHALLAVPTTAGSGSEATHFAVMYRGAVKNSIAHETMRPSHVLLIPEWTYSMPPFQTACSGMDALAQAVESQWARGATDESRAYARRALDLALQHLMAAVQRPDPVNREGMLEAAHAAGRAIDISKTTAAHAYSYVLTTEFGLPHGQAVGLLLPFFVGYHAAQGIPVKPVDESMLRELMADIRLARKLPVAPDRLCRQLEEQVNKERLNNNPVPIDTGLLRRIADALSDGR